MFEETRCNVAKYRSIDSIYNGMLYNLIGVS